MLHPGARRALWAPALLVLGCSDAPVEPEGCEAPQILQIEIVRNVSNVLSAIVVAEVRQADSVVVGFGPLGSEPDKLVPAVLATSGTTSVPVFGMTASTDYGLQVTAFNRCAAVQSEMQSFTTGPLPSDLPVYTASGTAPSPGFVVLAAGSYGLVIDNDGRVVWYHRFPNGPGLNFQAQQNGRYVARPSPATMTGMAQWTEVDPLGNVTRTMGCARGLQPRMHDFLSETDGSYWLLCDEVRTVDLAAAGGSSQAQVLGTVVQHITTDGDLLFEWSPFDHLEVELDDLSPADLMGPVINWTHGNALDLDDDGNLLLSFRNLSTVVKVDTRTGAIVWRMGGSHNEFAFGNVTIPPFARQHGLRATGKGALLLLDNLGDPISRAERYEYDEKRRTVRMSSSYMSSQRVIAHLGGTTQALPGGRTLVSFGNGGSVEEYDASGTVVWRLEGEPGYVFRAQRIRSLYQPGTGDPR